MKQSALALYTLCFLIFSQLSIQAQDNKLTKQEKKDGWQLLFDGKNTDGWKGAFIEGFPAKGWKISENALMVEPSGGAESTNGGDVVTKQVFDNFELMVDFKLTPGANGGVKYFVDPAQPKPANPKSAIGLEFQVLDDALHPDAKLGKNGNRTLGSLYDLIPAPTSKPAKPIGEWNTARIISSGSHVEHWLNGVKLLEYERGSTTFKALVEDSKYKDIPGFGLIAKGAILLQDHGNQVYYKNVKIRQLKVGEYGSAAATPYGMVSYTYRNSFSKNVAATLDTIKSLGITNIEFSNLFGKTAAELKQLLDERGMVCTSFGVGYADVVNKINEVGNNAKTLGASFVRVAWIPHDNKTGFTIADAKKTVDSFNTVGKILKEQYGLTFCYHNHGYEFAPYEGGTYYDYIVANTNPGYVSFELDILWAFHPGVNPADLLKKYPGRYRLMHVKDLRKGVKGDFSGGTPVDNDVALGTGQINIPETIKAAKKSSIVYYYIEDESTNVAAQVPISIPYLKNQLAGK